MGGESESRSKRKKEKLTKDVIKRLPAPDSGQYIVWDSEQKGFGVRITKGSKTLIAEHRVNGKTCRVPIHEFDSVDDARTKAGVLRGEMKEGIHPNEQKRAKRAQGITLREIWSDYKAIHDLRPKTLSIYEDALRLSFPDWLDRQVRTISKDDVEKRFLLIIKRGKSTAHQAMRVLRCLLNHARGKFEDADGRSILPENPVARLTQANLWKEAKPTRRQGRIHKDEVASWYKAVMALDNDVIRDLLLFCVLTGLRRGEASRLRWTEINFTTQIITISGAETKNHHQHSIPLSNFLVDLLSARNKLNATQFPDNEYVFPGRKKGDHIKDAGASIDKTIKAFGKSFMQHDLRRTFATIGESLDIAPYALKRLLNHKLTADVTAGYIVDDPERLRGPMQKITDAFLHYALSEPPEEPDDKPVELPDSVINFQERKARRDKATR